MSTSYYIVVGYLIEINQFSNLIQSRGCDHPVTEKQFCAECGAPIWKKREMFNYEEFMSKLERLRNVFGQLSGEIEIWIDCAKIRNEILIGQWIRLNSDAIASEIEIEHLEQIKTNTYVTLSTLPEIKNLLEKLSIKCYFYISC